MTADDLVPYFACALLLFVAGWRLGHHLGIVDAKRRVIRWFNEKEHDAPILAPLSELLVAIDPAKGERQ